LDRETLTVLYFADAARRAGVSEEQWPLPPEGDLRALRRRIFRRHPRLAELGGSLLWSVDEEMAIDGQVLRGGQRVGVMPPFSGG